MAAYLTVSGFKLQAIIPSSYVDVVETSDPGWTGAALERRSRWLDARLAKRYAVPFDGTNPPAVVVGWLTDLVTWDLYLKRGVDATDDQVDDIRKRYDTAQQEVKEAADSKDGLFELPLASTATANGVTRGSPQAYNEASPYRWRTLQGDAGRSEDDSDGR